MSRGALILVEGLDRAGKTTQTGRLVERLQKDGKDVELIKFPGMFEMYIQSLRFGLILTSRQTDRSTPIGKIINSYLVDRSFSLSDESAHLLFSANRWELASVIESKLKEGKYIVLDRYVYSGVAYTASKGIDRQWSLNPDIGLPKPDLTVFLKLNDTSDRSGFGDERYEVKEFQAKVRQQFEFFYNEPNWNTIIVDGKNIEQVESEIWNVLETKLFGPGVADEINKF